jgi:chromosome segregation ATPase
VQRRCDALESDLVATRSTAGSHGEQLDALAQTRATIEAELTTAREREAELVARVEALEDELARARTKKTSSCATASRTSSR